MKYKDQNKATKFIAHPRAMNVQLEYHEGECMDPAMGERVKLLHIIGELHQTY